MSTTLARAAYGLRPSFFEMDVTLRIRDSLGVWGRRIGPLESTQVALTPSKSKKIEPKSTLRGRFGQTNASISVPDQSAKIGLKFQDSGSKDLLLLALKGEEAELTQTGATLVDQLVTVPYLGSWLRLGHRNIQVTGFSGKDSADVALVANTDYVIDATWLRAGLIWIPAGATKITAGEVCKWSYTTLGVTGKTIKGDKLSSMTIDLLGLGRDLVPNSAGVQEDFELECWEIALDSNTSLDLRSGDNVIAFDFTGTLLTPSAKDSPYELRPMTLAAA